MTLPMIELILRRQALAETRRSLASLDIAAHAAACIWSDKAHQQMRSLRESMEKAIAREGRPEDAQEQLQGITEGILAAFNQR